MAPALPAGKFIVNALEDVSAKYPSPFAAVNVLVLIDPVCQSTVPVLPKPVCVAPLAKATVPPQRPNVTAEPSTTIGSVSYTHLTLPTIYSV